MIGIYKKERRKLFSHFLLKNYNQFINSLKNYETLTLQ